MNIHKLRELAHQFRHVILYGVIGLSALVFELLVFYVMSQKLDADVFVGNAAGMVVGLLFGFYFNARFNFRVSDRAVGRFFRYGMIALGGYLLTSSLIFGLTKFVGLEAFPAKLVSLPPYFFFQYTCNRLFTFQQIAQYETVVATESD